MTNLAVIASVSVTGSIEAAIDLGTAIQKFGAGLNKNFLEGTGADQANKVFADTRTLAASATEALDLNGSLLDAFGNAVNFTKVKALIITAAPGNTNNVEVGGAATNGFISPFGSATDKVKVRPGGAIALIAPDINGYSVTAATADLLQITNGGAGTGVTYNIVVVGV